jgi:hypothetical protein
MKGIFSSAFTKFNDIVEKNKANLPEIDISDILAKHDLQLTQGNTAALRHRNIEEFIQKKKQAAQTVEDSKPKSVVDGIVDTLTGGKVEAI